jgi:two-component system sensor histidine kinase/response regulator
MRTLPDLHHMQKIRMLDRFYGLFILFCLAMLAIGVPFVFHRKLTTGGLACLMLAGIFLARRMSRRGRPERSLILFSTGLWIFLLGLLYGGLPPNGAGIALATVVMMAIVVNNRTAVLYFFMYMLPWLAYILLGHYGMAPLPFFASLPLVAWMLVCGAFLLLLIPIPELVRSLNEGVSRQQSVLEATSDAVLVVNSAGALDAYNQKFVSIWGIPKALIDQGNDGALLDWVVSKLVNPQAFIQRVTDLYAHPDQSSFDTLELNDGRVIERFSHPNWVNGKVVGRVWSFRDVTDNRRAQEELQSSQAKLQGLFDLSPLGLTRNGMNGGFYEVNAAFTRMLGYSLEELNAMSYWDITPPDYADQEAIQLDHLRTKGAYGPYEKEYIHRDGHRFPVRLNGIQLRDANGDPYIWSIIEDITEQKAHEAKLTEASHAAQAASVAKSQFLANMSHEIRTPMNAITGLLNLLQATELTHRQRDYASKAEGAAQSLLGLLNDILDLSKVDAGKMSLENLPFRPDTVMRDLSVVLSANVKAKDIDVLFDVDPQLAEVVVGDALRLQQILINLGGNAIKFTEKGQVVIALRNVHSDALTNRIEFSVQDSGIGIAPEHQAQIFTGFAQAEASTTRRFGGTGLGLTISKSLVELMGGTLHLESTPGVGSTFSFEVEFPVVRDMPNAHLAPADPQVVAQRVLIVDDNPVAANLLQKMVHALGWQGEWTGSGQEALENVQREIVRHHGKCPYSLILMDWQMPQMDGWETIRRMCNMARLCDGAQPLVVMLSANGRQGLAQRSEEEQALVDGFLVKPVTASMLLEAVMEATSGNPGIRRLTAGRASKRQLAGMRILVVEDNLINQQVAEELLSGEGAIVSLAANGQLGVDAVRLAAPQFDVVLMDIQMPVMDGYTATGHIRSELGLVQLPIIAMTANVMASDREACMAAGMNEHIGKPFDMAKLVSQLLRSTGFDASADSQTTPVEASALPTPLPAPLAPVEGMDLHGALGRMSGSRSLYSRTARDFLNILVTMHAKLCEQFESNDKQKLAMTLHTLKGNAGTLGVTALAQDAKRLEQLCMSEFGSALCRQALNGLAATIDQARSLLEQAIAVLGVEAVASSPSLAALASGADAARALAELAALLAQSDMDALQKFADMRVQLEGLPDGLFGKLDAALQQLDFQAAYQICLGAK